MSAETSPIFWAAVADALAGVEPIDVPMLDAVFLSDLGMLERLGNGAEPIYSARDWIYRSPAGRSVFWLDPSERTP